MKAQELRISNIIKEGEIMECSNLMARIRKSPSDYGLFTINKLHPLEITPELLEKAGFIKRGIYYHFPDNDIFKLEQYKNKNAFWLRHGTESIDCVRINYYHQLQNLYFALTGKEITI